jgi:hypothetical protein
VGSITLLRDGRLLLAGTFISYNGTPANRLAIIATGGAIDPSFTAPAALDGSIGQIIEQEDGRFIVTGDFSGGPALRLTAVPDQAGH